MTTTQVVVVVFGTAAFLAVGSFVCVIIDRLPLRLDGPNEFGDLFDTRPWGEVFGGHSRCSSCDAPIGAVDNVPVVSFVMLRGRCRSCGERIPAFHPMVELAVALLFLVAAVTIGVDEWRLLPVLWLIPVGVAVAVIDQRTLIVPTRIVWPAFIVSLALCAFAAGMEGEWDRMVHGAVGLVSLAGPLFVLWFALPRGMGFGDVRLSVLLGFNLGFHATGRPVDAVFLALVCLTLAAVVGLVIGIGAAGMRGLKAKVPFGPALVIAALCCIFAAEPILEPFAG